MPKPFGFFISTHALREEGDRFPPSGRRYIAISTHALREEGDKSGLTCEKSIVIFLPTPSARRATQKTGRRLVEGKISTHALREEGDVRCTGRFPQHFISTHALREEGDRQSTKTG